VRGVFGESQIRTMGPGASAKKRLAALVGHEHSTFYDRKIPPVRNLPCGDTRVYVEVEFRRVTCRSCDLLKQEKLTCSDNALYTNRFAFFVRRRCLASTLKD
jgi:hypothetical protein